ncbi:MAG: 4'-phosphopantetheinyl transferase superfamily protein [Cyclobacteriaceae bacterium]
MPSQDLISLQHGHVALWHITESEEELTASAQPEQCPEQIISGNKRLEWLAGRVLIKELAKTSGLEYKGIYKDQFGKPFLTDALHHISLSHSYPYVAAQINPQHAVGIDIEQPKQKLLKIAPRILDEEELADAGENVEKHCIYWCAKEALYKVHGRRGLLFATHLKIAPFEIHPEGRISGIINFESEKITVNLQYFVKKEFVLVYSI